MTARNYLSEAPPYAVEQAIERLGANLRTARLRRNLTIAGVAEKIGTGPRAVMDAEKGKPSTGIVVYVALLWAYDLLGPASDLADPARDEEGLPLMLCLYHATRRDRTRDRRRRRRGAGGDANRRPHVDRYLHGRNAAKDTHRHRDRWSYVRMAEELRRICANPDHQAAELYRRMCFNALISNTDDHPRNHALIARETAWKLSPAYDLMPDTPVSRERRELAMSCGDWGRYANATNLLSQSARIHLKRQEAEAAIDAMENQVATSWYEIARREGVSEQDCEKIRSAFAYPGFRLDLSEQQSG